MNMTGCYIDGKWTRSNGQSWSVINPSNEETCRTIRFGEVEDVNRAVGAARRALAGFSSWSIHDRAELFRKITEVCTRRSEEFVAAISDEMGATLRYARSTHVPYALEHFGEMIELLSTYQFSYRLKNALILREPIGVCGLITPWNWPLGQVTAKVALAFAAGCTVVIKPSEWAPTSAMLFADVLNEVGLPPGVFNLVNGDGPVIGAAIARHIDVDMVSFTGSTRAGIEVARDAALSVKRVAQELGGKSPSIILPNADLVTFVPATVGKCFENAGQACQAPTLLFVHKSQRDEAVRLSSEAAARITVGDPRHPSSDMGPVATKAQYDKIQRMIRGAVSEGATLVCGGAGRPHGIDRGFFVRPTIFADVGRSMQIAREEIFGPVLSILTYETEDEVVELANRTEYGLAAYIQSNDPAKVSHLARRIRSGRVYFNYAPGGPSIPFGGFKQSGNGREHGVFGLEEYLEVKAVLGLPEVD